MQLKNMATHIWSTSVDCLQGDGGDIQNRRRRMSKTNVQERYESKLEEIKWDYGGIMRHQGLTLAYH